ncbi:MAG: DUF971 domain-containing protein [Pseudomonadota bacterium]
MQTPPQEIRLRKESRLLVVDYGELGCFELPFEYLRVYSPSAEVKGHGPGQETLQVGKEQVDISRIEPVGHYALRLVFDDGHDSGLYSWKYLLELGLNHAKWWRDYLDRLAGAGYPARSD